MKNDGNINAFAHECKRQDEGFQIFAKASRLWYQWPYIAPVENPAICTVDNPAVCTVDNPVKNSIEVAPEPPPVIVRDVIALIPRANAARHKVVIAAVGRATKLKPTEITGKSRHRRYVTARHTAAWILVKICGISYVRTGRWLGNRDHSSMIHGVRNAEVKHQALIDQVMADLDQSGWIEEWTQRDGVEA